MATSEETDVQREVLDGIGRRKTRYWCFRFRTEAAEGVSSDDAPAGLREVLESLPFFGGWETFGVSWDIHEEDLSQIIPLRFSLEQQWNSEAWSNARPMPVARDKAVEDAVAAAEKAKEVTVTIHPGKKKRRHLKSVK